MSMKKKIKSFLYLFSFKPSSEKKMKARTFHMQFNIKFEAFIDNCESIKKSSTECRVLEDKNSESLNSTFSRSSSLRRC